MKKYPSKKAPTNEKKCARARAARARARVGPLGTVGKIVKKREKAKKKGKILIGRKEGGAQN